MECYLQIYRYLQNHSIIIMIIMKQKLQDNHKFQFECYLLMV